MGEGSLKSLLGLECLIRFDYIDILTGLMRLCLEGLFDGLYFVGLFEGLLDGLLVGLREGLRLI